jgi:hypothetical protein
MITLYTSLGWQDQLMQNLDLPLLDISQHKWVKWPSVSSYLFILFIYIFYLILLIIILYIFVFLLLHVFYFLFIRHYQRT